MSEGATMIVDGPGNRVSRATITTVRACEGGIVTVCNSGTTVSLQIEGEPETLDEGRPMLRVVLTDASLAQAIADALRGAR